MTIFDVFNLAGGLALFLYGMSIMGSGLEKLAGSKLESILGSLTSSLFKGVLLGAVLTSIVQSSSATTVIVVGLVNSGIIKLSQAIGVIMGANIGTTATAQILRLTDIGGDNILLQLLNPKSFTPILALIGAVLYLFFKQPKRRNLGQILIGIGILFSGMYSMESSVTALRSSPAFVYLFTSLQNPILGILAGTVVTGIIQSSSASVGILQALSSTGVVTWSTAIPIIMGQNIGTCVTALISSIGASKGARQAAFVHLYFNLIGSLVFIAAIYGFKYMFGIAVWNNVIGKGDIANFHTIFNIACTVSFIPFAGFLEKLAKATVKEKPGDIVDLEMPILDERLFTSPTLALQQARSAVELMARHSRANYTESMPLLLNYSQERVQTVTQRENIIDRLEVAINNYFIKMTQRELTVKENRSVSHLLYMVTQFERIGDYSVNIMERSGEVFDKSIAFTGMATSDLALLTEAVTEVIDLTIVAFTNNDLDTAEKVEPLEETIDIMCERLHDKHINRLKLGLCATEAGVVFLEVLTDIERISDHCSNVATHLIGFNTLGEFDAHKLNQDLHNGLVKNYNELFEMYKAKYFDKLVIE